jgi:hypothetical protein
LIIGWLAGRGQHGQAGKARVSAEESRTVGRRHAGSILRTFAQQGSDVRTELIAGVTTFLTMVYIVFINPIILGKAGMDQGAVFVATCVAAAVSTLVMALYANIVGRFRRPHGDFYESWR